MFITALLSSADTAMALDGQAFSQSLHPIQVLLSTCSESLANRPNSLCKVPNGQIRLWNTSGLYLSVTSTDMTSQNGRIGKSMCSSFFDISMTATLIPKDIHAKYPFLNHFGVVEV